MCLPQPTANSYWFVSPAQALHLRREALSAGMGGIFRWLGRRKQHRALGELDARLLDDVGLTRSDVDRELATAIGRAFRQRHMR